MEGNDSLDGLFKNRFEEGEASVPAGSWQSITQKLAIEKEKKYKGFIIPIPVVWITASFIAGSLSGAVSYYVYNLKKENNSLKQWVSQQSAINEFKTEIGQITSPIPKGTEISETYSFSFASDLPSKLRNAHPQFVLAPYVYYGKSALNSIEANNRRSISRSFPAKGRLKSTSNTDHTKEKNIAAFPTHYEEIVAEESNVQNDLSQAHISNDINQNAIPSIKRDTIYIPVESKAIEQDKKIKNAIKVMGFPITVGMYVGPEIASRSINFSENTDPELVKYKQKDEGKFGFSAGLSLDIHLPKNFYIRTGVNYWNVGEKNTVLLKHTDYDTSITTSHTSSSSITNVIKINGIPANLFQAGSDSLIWTAGNLNTVPVNGTVYKQSALDITKTNTDIRENLSQFSSTVSNNYHYLGIPLILGMKLNNKKLSFGMFSGLITNVLVSPSKSIYYIYYDPEQPDKFVQSKRDLARFSMVYTGGADIDYRIAKQWTFSLSPNVKYALTSIYKGHDQAKQLPYSFGLQFGVKYRLGN